MTRMIPLLWTIAFIALACFFVWALTPSAHAQNVAYESQIPVDKPVDLKRVASAIKAVENSPRDYVGYAGERSSYQITEDVWNQHSPMPHEWASGSDPVCTNETLKVVHRHLDWIVSQLQKNRYTVTPYAIGLVWKGGWGRFSHHHERFSDTSYGQRVLAVYSETSK